MFCIGRRELFQSTPLKCCLYVMMDHFLDLIVDVEVMDKREAGGTSSLMEKMGCKRIFERMLGILNLQELVTDASSVIMKMVRELKGNVVVIYNLIFYSLPHMLCIEKWSDANRLPFSVILYT